VGAGCIFTQHGKFTYGSHVKGKKSAPAYGEIGISLSVHALGSAAATPSSPPTVISFGRVESDPFSGDISV